MMDFFYVHEQILITLVTGETSCFGQETSERQFFFFLQTVFLIKEAAKSTARIQTNRSPQNRLKVRTEEIKFYLHL